MIFLHTCWDGSSLSHRHCQKSVKSDLCKALYNAVSQPGYCPVLQRFWALQSLLMRSKNQRHGRKMLEPSVQGADIPVTEKWIHSWSRNTNSIKQHSTAQLSYTQQLIPPFCIFSQVLPGQKQLFSPYYLLIHQLNHRIKMLHWPKGVTCVTAEEKNKKVH